MFQIPHIFIDGPACIGKTSVIRQIQNSKLLDFHERCEIYPILKKKGENTPLQILATAAFMETVATTKTPSIIDRSPLSDIIYHLVFEKIKNPSFNFVKEIKQLPEDLTAKFKIIIFIPPHQWTKEILEEMKTRNNGIDTLTEEYVERQNEIFEIFGVTHYAKNMIWIDKKIKYKSPEHFDFMKRQINRIMKEELQEVKKEITFGGNTKILQSYDYDAGFNLSANKRYETQYMKPIKIECNEKVFIEKGYYGYVTINSRWNTRIIVQPGTFDAEYSGPWSITIIPLEPSLIIHKHEIIAQVIFLQLPNVKIKQISREQWKFKEQQSKRKSNGFGSTGQFKIPRSDFYTKWQHQPNGEDEEKQYKQDERNLLTHL